MAETEILQIGASAYAKLMANPAGTIYGRTSRGDFLSLSDGSVVFLSFEGYAGPLTVNIVREPVCCNRLKTGDMVNVESSAISFPKCSWRLIFPQTNPWIAPPPSRPALPSPRRLFNLAAIASHCFQIKQAGSLSCHLAAWLDIPVEPAPRMLPLPEPASFRRAWLGGQTEEIIQPLARCIGLGSGLTPSGDDFLLGFLLAHRRWPDLSPTRPSHTDLADEICRLSRGRTTRLSSGLILAAAEGQADERLIRGLDAIICHEGNFQEVAGELASWGSQSGLDVLTGFGLYVLSTMED